MMPILRRYGGRILIWLVLVGLLCGAVSIWMPYQRELRITARIERVGGEVIRQYKGPTWLPQSPLDKLAVFDRIYGVEFHGDATPPEVLAELHSLPHLERLNFTHSEVTDRDLEQLKRLVTLGHLNLRHTQVTDQGLARLEHLTNLSFLQLDYTGITDAGLDHLKGLSRLRFIHLENTQTTAEGRARLQKALPNCTIKPAP